MSSRFLRLRNSAIGLLAVAVPAALAVATAAPAASARTHGSPNEFRQTNLVSDLTTVGAQVVDPDLVKLAEAQSMAMASRNKLDHDVKGPLAKRLSGSGYHATSAVENVSAGYHTLAEAFSGWRDSPPHRANMLSRDVTKLGIAASYAPNTKYKVFWTLILASTDAK